MQIEDLEPFVPEMITLPRGKFLMGSPRGELGNEYYMKARSTQFIFPMRWQ